MGSPLGDRQIDFRESHLFIGAAIGELIGEELTSAVEDEHLDSGPTAVRVYSHGWFVSKESLLTTGSGSSGPGLWCKCAR